jgi:hypothetical protein
VRVLGILSLVSMALSGGVVGLRLLALGRRTRQQPELLMGLGLLLVAVLGGPLAAVGRLPALLATTLGDVVFALGLAATQLGIALFCAFTWRVFRGDTLWATLLLLGLAGALGAEWLGLLHASARGATMEEILPYTRPWAIAIVTTLALAFAWTAGESFAHYRRLLRQLAIGLGDPVVANRLLLWATAGFATVLLCAVIVASMLAGLAPLRHALPLGAIGAAALCASTCWTLAFLPPAWYLAALRGPIAHAAEPSRSTHAP